MKFERGTVQECDAAAVEIVEQISAGPINPKWLEQKISDAIKLAWESGWEAGRPKDEKFHGW